MTLQTFTPPIPPSVGAINKPRVRILKSEFGDGYVQATRDGINHVRAEFSLAWEVLTPSQFDAIVSFIEARGGAEPFLWTAPGKTSPQKWTCEEWSSTFNGAGLCSVRATFLQSFNLT